MKGFVRCCALALAACLALAGCAPSLPPQPTLDELLAEVNAEHQAVRRPRVNESQYLREAPDEESIARFTEGEQTAFDPDAELTAAQAAEDVEYSCTVPTIISAGTRRLGRTRQNCWLNWKKRRAGLPPKCRISW